MVARSDLNYPQHLKDIYNYFLPYGEQKASDFIKFYQSRYNKHGRSFINYKIAWLLYDDWLSVKKSGIRWYAIVGVGGTGKTTLAKNINYFLDDTFGVDRIKYTAKEIVKSLKQFLEDKERGVGVMKSLLLDEPDKTIMPQSKEGQLLGNILGKARQQQIFMVYCATDLSDIPNYIYKKLSGIFFTPQLRKGMFFKDKPKKYSYPLGQIKREYYRKGYSIFFELKKSKGCIMFDTIKGTPLSAEEEKKYNQEKIEDYEKSINLFLKTSVSDRTKLVMKLRTKGKTLKEIGELIGVTEARVSQIVKKNNSLKP